uniref:Membrane-bound lytic murein transglycosylase F n=1 Tax=Arsenophonus endosymbiont of Trialeurodes vaporariorum TaxID=235567 RepID=A0A3B0M0P8_9GAMM
MANAETLRDFLISLGFKIDDSGMRKFQSVVTGVSVNVIKLGATVEGAALAVVGFTTQIAAGLDKMYWASQRTGASVNGIKALGYAASLTGSSAEAASGSLENLARFLRNSPGAEGFLNRLGVQTRDANGNLQDMSAIFTRVGNKLASMPYYRANQYAQLLGIDENTLMAMRRGINAFPADYQRMLKQTGFNADLAAKQSNQFMTSMKGLTGLFGILRDKIGSHLAGGLSSEIDNLRKRLLDNFPKIERVLTSVIKGIIQASGMVSRVIWQVSQVIRQVFDWWRNLDKKSKKLITTFSGLAAAIWVLNRAFFASPVGIITGLIAALLLLWEDYQTWKEGGKSFIDWSKWEGAINLAKAAFTWLGDKLNSLAQLVGGWQNALESVAVFIAGRWLSKVLGAFGQIKKLPMPPWMAGLAAYMLYLDQDKNNIKASVNSSWDYNTRQVKRAIGNSLRFFGIYNSWANQNQGGNIPDNIADVPTGRPKPSASGRQLLGWLQPTLGKLEQLYRLPEGLLRSVAITESGGNQFAISRAGAKGLFQLMDGTARDLGLKGNDVFYPVKSAQAAARYLAQLFKMNGGDIEKTLAAYNWGIGNVQRHRMVWR